jgi:hypothetical protein
MYSTGPIDLSFSYLRSAVEDSLDIKKGSYGTKQNFNSLLTDAPRSFKFLEWYLGTELPAILVDYGTYLLW